MKTIEDIIHDRTEYNIIFQKKTYNIHSQLKSLISEHRSFFPAFGTPLYDTIHEIKRGLRVCIDTDINNIDLDGFDDISYSGFELYGNFEFEYKNGVIEIYVVPKEFFCPECDGTGTCECSECNQMTDCKICEGLGGDIIPERYFEMGFLPKRIPIKTINLNQGELF